MPLTYGEFRSVQSPGRKATVTVVPGYQGYVVRQFSGRTCTHRNRMWFRTLVEAQRAAEQWVTGDSVLTSEAGQ